MSDTALESNGVISLAQMAGLDVSEVAELRRTDLPEGLFTFEIKSAKLAQREKDGETLFGAMIQCEVLEAKGIVDRDFASEEAVAKLIGAKHNEFRNIDPAQYTDHVGYLKGFLTDIGVPDVSGAMGGVPDETDDNGNPIVGFLDRSVGHVFAAKIKRTTGKDGVTRSNIVPLVVKR
jgi:hypothetical protein